jgi:general secretion pathway protein I
MTTKRGFTLLEVLVAVAILGLGLTAILSAQAGSFASAAHARNISVATGLLRCKMSEVEEHLYREGFQDTDETGSGPCCETDEVPNMRCTWHADRPLFPDSKLGDLDLSAGLSLGGSGAPSGAMGALGLLAGAAGTASPLGTATSVTDIAKTLAEANTNANAIAPPSSATPLPITAPSGSGSAMPFGLPVDAGLPGDPGAGAGAGSAMGGLASMAMSFVYPTLKQLFEASTRRITATLTFREGKKEYSIDVIEWFAVPQLGLAPTDDPNADPTATSGTSAPSSTSAAARSASGAVLKAPGTL